MKTQARSITTNQTGVHEDLPSFVKKHQQHSFKRPIATHTQLAFDSMISWLHDWSGDVIIDACCGVGESTINIAKQYPHARVIGVDKSIARLEKHLSYAKDINKSSMQAARDNKVGAINEQTIENNYILLQADLADFWRLLVDCIAQNTSDNSAKWQVVKQFILYPNPYPKKSQLSKRWHGSALMPYIMKVCDDIELRSNWRLYLEEFLAASVFYGFDGHIEAVKNQAITPFERKYLASSQTCFKLEIRASGCDR